MHACSNGLCTLYALRTLCHLARQVGAAPMAALAAQWAPPLWRLLLAEPVGADYWVRAAAASASAQVLDLVRL